MRKTLLTSVAVLGLALAAPAFAADMGGMPNDTGMTAPPHAGKTSTIPSPHRLMREGAMNPATGARYGHVPGDGVSLPLSGQASNITPTNTHSVIAPTLPTPPVNPNAGAEQFLNVAKQALARHRTGEAQEALERAETRRLDIDVTRNISPNDDPMIAQIRAAREALGRRDIASADQQISGAMSIGPTAGNMPGGDTGGGMSRNPGMQPNQTSGMYQGGTPSGNPYRTSQPGTLGTEVSPPGSPMNPNGEPQ
jgi:hypothetical protein